jgi:hypothetical protein
MSYGPERRGFAIGQEVGRVGSLTRLVLGLLGLVYIAMNVSQTRPNASLIGQVAGGAILSTILYVVIFWVLDERVLSHLHPWIHTGMFWAPLALVPFCDSRNKLAAKKTISWLR